MFNHLLADMPQIQMPPFLVCLTMTSWHQGELWSDVYQIDLFTEHLWVLIPDVLMVLTCEFLVDWVKHAFIVKFNEIPVEVYKEYTVSIAYDLAASRHKNVSKMYFVIHGQNCTSFHH